MLISVYDRSDISYSPSLDISFDFDGLEDVEVDCFEPITIQQRIRQSQSKILHNTVTYVMSEASKCTTDEKMHCYLFLQLLMYDTKLYQMCAPKESEVLQSISMRSMISERGLIIGDDAFFFETEHTHTFSLYSPLTSRKDAQHQLFNLWNSTSSNVRQCVGPKPVLAPLPVSTAPAYTRKQVMQRSHELGANQRRALFETSATAHVVRPDKRKMQTSIIKDIDAFSVTCILAYCACETEESILGECCNWMLSEDKTEDQQRQVVRAWCCMLGSI